jgi:hypothetical protein
MCKRSRMPSRLALSGPLSTSKMIRKSRKYMSC